MGSEFAKSRSYPGLLGISKATDDALILEYTMPHPEMLNSVVMKHPKKSEIGRQQ